MRRDYAIFTALVVALLLVIRHFGFLNLVALR